MDEFGEWGHESVEREVDAKRNETREIVRRHFDDFNSHNTTRLLAGLQSDVEWTTGQDRMSGVAQVEEIFDDGLWNLSPHLFPEHFVIEGHRAAVRCRESIVIDGLANEFQIAIFFEIRDGLIASVKVYREGSADFPS
ncbi:MAG: nuclear transport factor 2 family protein [Acidimicrobiales bacterium]